MRRHARFLFVLGLVFLCVIVTVLFFAQGLLHKHANVLRVVFFDIGQGDSIFIESPTGVQVLVDGGPDRTVLRTLSHELGFFDRSLDMVVATHEDKDHIGGLPEVFTHYQVGTFLRTENQGDSGAAHLIDSLSATKGIAIVYARRGMDFDLGGGATLSVLFPDRDPAGWEANTSSIVARLTYGNSEFLLTGDSPKEIEKYLVSLDARGLESDVLKLGHHGSHTASSDEYLDVVHPLYAIVSAGKHNRYGHPHKDVVDRVVSKGITVLSTADRGSIAFETDGTSLVLEK